MEWTRGQGGREREWEREDIFDMWTARWGGAVEEKAEKNAKKEKDYSVWSERWFGRPLSLFPYKTSLAFSAGKRAKPEAHQKTKLTD